VNGAGLLTVAAGLVALGIGALRLGWRRRSSWAFAPTGWAMAALGLLLLAFQNGAWGLAVGGLVGSATALLLLAHAGLRDRPAPAGPVRSSRTTLRLHEDGHLQLGRRVLTFLLVVPGAMAASMAAGLAAQALTRAAGWTEPDSTALGLFAFPTAWALLATVMMLRNGAVSMTRPLAATLAASGILIWIAT